MKQATVQLNVELKGFDAAKQKAYELRDQFQRIERLTKELNDALSEVRIEKASSKAEQPKHGEWPEHVNCKCTHECNCPPKAAAAAGWDGWHKVEDGPPETLSDKMVFMSDGINFDHHKQFVAHYSISLGAWFDARGFILSDVTHWRELPAPPETKSKEDKR